MSGKRHTKAKSRGKRQPKTKGEQKPPDKPPLELVKDEGSSTDAPSDPTPGGDKPEPTPESELRPLNPVDALQYKFALLQEELVEEKRKLIALKRKLIDKDQEILALSRENVALREIIVNREEQDLFRVNDSLLKRLGVGEAEEVLVENGRLFVAPKGTASKRNNG